MADDRVPVPVRFDQVSGGDLKRERFVVRELGSAVEAEARNDAGRIPLGMTCL